jgi:hypothetical protein
MGAIVLNGKVPSSLLEIITAGLVFLISAPIVGSRLITQISLRFIDEILKFLYDVHRLSGSL